MCGRYTLHLSQNKLADVTGLTIPDSFVPEYNIGPGRTVLSIALEEKEHRAAGMMHWGLKTPQNFHIKARLESADTTPRFRESWLEHRCLIPANGFYEWYQDGITKQPYYLYPADHELSYFAALWFPPAFEGDPAACVLLTTEAHPSIRAVHDRMPVVLTPEAHADWLSGTMPKREVAALAAAVEFEHHPVSHRVNSIHNNDSRLINVTAANNDDQMRLF